MGEHLDGIHRDLKYTLRRLCATPGFTLVSIGTLALGLGATSAIFSVINGVLLKPLPYIHPEQLVAIWMTAPGVKITDLNMDPSVYFTMHDEQRAFQAVSMFGTGGTFVTGKSHPEEVQTVFATHELLPILGIRPQLGRSFSTQEDDPSSERTVMLSDGYWRSHFGADRAVLGRRITVEGNQVTIIGFLPAFFEFMDQKPDLLLPLRVTRSGLHLLGFSYLGVGRLKPGVTIKQASADFARVLPMVPKLFPPRSFLVVLQVALALILLLSSGLMMRTFRNLHNVDPGFRNAQQVQTLRVGITDEDVKDPEGVMQMEEAMLSEVVAVNGVLSASIISSVPMGGGEHNDPVYAADKAYREGTIPPLRRYKSIAPGYFATMGQRMLAGRDLTWADTYNGGDVAIVSENMARDLWKTPEAALGKRIRPNEKDDWREVIGVVADEHSDGVDKPAPTIVHWPLLTKNFEGTPLDVQRYVSFVVRTPRAGSLSLQKQVQNALWSIDSNLPVEYSDTLETFYNRSLARTSFTLLLLAIAGSMALILGLVGIYGAISYSVTQRTREIGIRLALGAQVTNVTTAFVRSGLILSAIGCGCGLAVAFGLAPLMKSLLFSVSSSDPLTYGAMSVSLILAAALASYFPARKAAKVDPVEALRAE